MDKMRVSDHSQRPNDGSKPLLGAEGDSWALAAHDKNIERICIEHVERTQAQKLGKSRE